MKDMVNESEILLRCTSRRDREVTIERFSISWSSHHYLALFQQKVKILVLGIKEHGSSLFRFHLQAHLPIAFASDLTSKSLQFSYSTSLTFHPTDIYIYIYYSFLWFLFLHFLSVLLSVVEDKSFQSLNQDTSVSNLSFGVYRLLLKNQLINPTLAKLCTCKWFSHADHV